MITPPTGPHTGIDPQWLPSDTDLINWVEKRRARAWFSERAEQEQAAPWLVEDTGLRIDGSEVTHVLGYGDTWRAAVEDAMHNEEDCR